MRNSPVWTHVWHEGSQSVEELVVQMANHKKLRFGFAESCTGGLCSHRITNVSGASSVFMGSVIAYDNSVKEKFLGVESNTLESFGAVSIETAQEMARGLREKMNLDVSISITGIAGPHGGSLEKPVGTVCVGFSTKVSTEAVRLQFFGEREILKNRFSQAALFTLLEQLEKFAGQ
jgi:nicotinamide-nucleotide amidase